MEARNHPEMPTAMTLSQFSRYVGQALSREPVLLGAWVVAELSDLSISGGHCYMTLIEKDSTGTTVARMRATVWANRYAYIRKKFLNATGRELAAGMKVMLYGGINYHISYGLSLNIGEIDPSYTMGDLERLRREILIQLQKEGVLGQNREKTMTEPPQKIAIISSAKAAGYGDFIHQLEGNSGGAVFYHCLFPATMQGERTAATVVAALDMVEESRSIIDWDCVVIIRGGGATTDMNGFDDLELARRVATYPIPVIVGIGHERDRCVLDEIACVRCKTPTAAAAWILDRVAYDWQKSIEITQRIAAYASDRLKGEQLRLQSAESLIPSLAANRLKSARLRLHGISSKLPHIALGATAEARVRLQNLSTTLKMSVARTIERNSSKLESLEKLIAVLDPASTLRRGYSITRINGHALTDSSEIKEGDTIETRLAKGSVLSEVTGRRIVSDLKR